MWKILTSMHGRRHIRCVLIADDLTGACDAGVQFVSAGLCCTLRVNWQDGGQPESPDVVAYSTDTRDVPAPIAAARIESLAATLDSLVPEIIFKKIDSTFRGNVAAEIKTCMEQFGCSCAVIAPAFPAMQRTVKAGILHWQDCSGGHAVNIASALRESVGPVAAVRGIPSKSGVGLLGGEAPSGAAELAHEMQRAMQSETNWFLVDSVVQQDLARIAVAGAQLKERVLWAGSAGLAMALAGCLQSSRVSRNHQPAGGPLHPNAPKPGASGAPMLHPNAPTPGASGTPMLHPNAPKPGASGAPMVFCIGSDHPVTISQQETLLGATDALLVKAGITLLDDARRALREGRHLVLQVERGETKDFELREFFFGLADLGGAGMLITGGDTGAMICRVLGIDAISLQGEIVVGLPWGIARGGPMEGLRVATKSGGFGMPDALVRTAEFFSGKVAR